METKKDIRKRVLEIRNNLCIDELKKKSHIICKKIINHPFFLEADIIACYLDYRNEVQTREIVDQAWKMQKKVAVPRVEGDEMQFYYLSSFSDLREGYRGIMEPDACTVAELHNALVIIPGVAFDKTRNRIGYGKGFYDKFMSRHSEVKSIAIAFECQVVEEIPKGEYDYCPNILITEENIYDE